MAEILSMDGSTVRIGMDDGSIFSAPIASITYPSPRIGDNVQVYQDANATIVKRAASDANIRTVDKNVHVWVFNFLLGCLGVDRFVRGQVGLGILKLVVYLVGVWFLGLGAIWPCVDWIISMVKAYGSAYGTERDLTFGARGAYLR